MTEQKKKHAGGRPSKYDPLMCERVIELMSEGASKVEVAADLKIARDTLTDWTHKNKEFSAAIKIGEELSEAWWMGIARENLIERFQGSKLNATLWYMNMKNRFGWKDKQEIEHSGDKENPIVVINAGANPYA